MNMSKVTELDLKRDRIYIGEKECLVSKRCRKDFEEKMSASISMTDEGAVTGQAEKRMRQDNRGKKMTEREWRMGLGEILIRYLLEAVKFSLGNEIFCKKRQNYAVLLLGAAACVPLWFCYGNMCRFLCAFCLSGTAGLCVGSLRCPVRERCAAFLKIIFSWSSATA